MSDDQGLRIALAHLTKAVEQLAAGNAAGAAQYVENAKWWMGS
jgi:hypothetical protein